MRPVHAFALASLTGFTQLTAQQQLPPPVQWFPAAAAPAAGPWQTLFDGATLAFGRYRLAAKATDAQTPHDRDEVYVVLAGSAKLAAGSETRAVGPGDAVFVAAAVEHHFVEVTADLDVLVVFAAARPATGGMAAGPRPTEQTPYPETSARGNTRIFYWFGPDSAGQVAIDHGQPRWNPKFEAFLQRPGGPRWRCGENFWTTLDTNMDLVLGGVDVPIGSYYVVLQHGEHGLELVLLDPQQVRAQRLDAYEAPKTTGGLLVPLQSGTCAMPTARLQIELTVDRSARDRGALAIRFGPHELTATLAMHPHRD